MYKPFKPGRIIKKFRAEDGREVVFRYPKLSDVDDCLKLINSLIGERARILLVKKLTKRGEYEWLRNVIKDMKSGKKIQILVDVGGRVAGSAEIRRKKDTAESHIGDLGISIAKGYRDIGIGSELIKTLIQMAKEKWKIEIAKISVISDNKRAMHVYKKLGFRIVGRIPGGYKREGKYLDEILLVKEV